MAGAALVEDTRVLIVDDEPDMRAWLQTTIDLTEPAVAVVGEAGSGTRAIEQWRETRPDVVILDQRMPGMTGLDAAEQILAEEPTQAVVLFTAFDDRELRRHAARLGIRACVSKSDMPQLFRVLQAIGRR